MPLITVFVATMLAASAPTRGTVTVAPPGPGGSKALAVFADAVETSLAEAGFTLVPGAAHARHVATVEVTRTVRGAMRTTDRQRTTAAGGGTVFGNGAGVGMTVEFGKRVRNTELVGTELTLRIVRQQERAPAWEGRAITYQVGGSRGDEPVALAKKLSAAILRNYDGPSGVLVSVP